MKTPARTAVALLIALAVPVAGMSAAHGSGGGNDVTRRGSCSGSTDWKIKAKPDNGRIELEAEVDSNHSGQVWDWTIKHNGSMSAKGASRTRGVSGSFTVRRLMANVSGTDHFVFRAERRATGDVCRGTISL